MYSSDSVNYIVCSWCKSLCILLKMAIIWYAAHVGPCVFCWQCNYMIWWCKSLWILLTMEIIWYGAYVSPCVFWLQWQLYDMLLMKVLLYSSDSGIYITCCWCKSLCIRLKMTIIWYADHVWPCVFCWQWQLYSMLLLWVLVYSADNGNYMICWSCKSLCILLTM